MARDVRIEKQKTGSQEAAVKAELSSELVAGHAAQVAVDKLAENVVVLDVRGLSSYADFLVLMTATGERHAESLARSLDDELREIGERPFGVEGERGGAWVLIDTGDVVVHVFQEDARGFYDLDSLWTDAPRKEYRAKALAE